MLLWRRGRLCAELLEAYCSFGFFTMSSVLPGVWNAERSFCIRTFCITTPWVEHLMVVALATPFLLTAVWARRKASQSAAKPGGLKPGLYGFSLAGAFDGGGR